MNQSFHINSRWAGELLQGKRDANGQEYGLSIVVRPHSIQGNRFVIELQLVGRTDGVVAATLLSPPMTVDDTLQVNDIKGMLQINIVQT